MLKLSPTSFLLFFLLTITLSFNPYIKSEANNKTQNEAKRHTMSISVNLYRVSTAEKPEDLTNLAADLEEAKSSKVDLYKMGGDLRMVFTNDIDEARTFTTIPVKMLYGNRFEKTINDKEIGGFLPTSEVKQVVDWIKQNKIETIEGFSKKYEGLSNEVKKELQEWGSPSKEELFKFFVKPLVEFYFAALKGKNSIIITGE